MISQRLKKTILKNLELEDFDFEDSTRASDVPGWDSLKHASIVLAVEREFGVRFKTIEVLRLKTVSDLQVLLDRKLNEGS